MGPGVGLFIKAIFVGAAAVGAPTGAAYALALNIARIAIMAVVAKITAPRLDLTAAAHNKLVTVRDTVAPQKFMYGQDMVSGPIIYSALAAPVPGDDLYFCIALTGHECNDVLSYMVDDTVIPLANLSGPKDGTVDGGKYAGVAEVDIALGTSTQAALTLLTVPFASTWTSAHTARGWTIMAWRFSLVDGLEDAYASGEPRSLKVLLQGYKVYDPRLDGSIPGGTGLHRVADATTWEWSDNPALCLAHFIIDTKFGMREDATRVDWSMVQTAADVCEETVSIPGPSTQDRYTCNATFLATEPRSDVRDTLLGAMMGRMVFSQGLWKMWAGEAVTADVTLTEANLAGAIQLQASTSSKERYNEVRGKFVDADRQYLAASYITQTSSVYVTEDGGELREVVADMLHTNNEFEAQRKAIIFLKQSRNQRIVSFQGNFSCFRIQPGATVNLDLDEYGFAGEKFFVSEWSFSPEGIQLSLVEEDDTVWADPLVGDYSTRTSTGVIISQGTGVSPPTALTAVPAPQGVLLSWTNPTSQLFDHIEIWLSYDNVRGNAVLHATTQADSYVDATSNSQRLRYYWIRAVDAVGRVSTWEPDLTTTTAVDYPEVGEGNLIADPLIRLGASYWDLFLNATYVTGLGLNGTDVIELTVNDTAGGQMELVERRGPEVWDIKPHIGMMIECRWRARVTASTGTWEKSFLCNARISNEALGHLANNPAVGRRVWTSSDIIDDWYDDSCTVEIFQFEGAPVSNDPKYINMILQLSNILGPGNEATFEVESFSAIHTASKFQGESVPGLVPAANNTEGGVLKDDGTWGQNPSGQKDSRYAFDTSISPSLPSAGNIRFNNATLASVTNLYASSTDEDGWGNDPILGFLVTGNRIYIEGAGDTSQSAVFEVSGTPTDNTNWWTIPVSVVASDTLPTTGQNLNFTVDFTPAAGGGGDVTASGAPLNNEVAVFTAATDIDSDATFTWDGTTLEATQFAGIAKANLLDKSAGEIITLPASNKWDFTSDGTGSVELSSGTDFRMDSNDDGAWVIFNHNNGDFRLSMGGAGNGSRPFQIGGFLDLRLVQPIQMAEQAAADTFIGGYGQIWVKTAIPNQLWFTDDTGVDVQLGAAGGNVSNTGTPLNNQIAIWTDATTIEGVTNLTYDGTDFDVNANLFIGGDAIGHFETVSGIEGSVQADGKDGSTGFFAGYAVGNRSGFFDTVGTLTTNEIVIHDQLNGNYVLRYNANQSSHHTSLYDDGTLKLQTLATGILAIGDVGASTFSGVALTTGGVATNFLNETGAYSVPPGGSGTVGGTGTDNFLAVWNGTANIDAVGSFLVTNAVDKSAVEAIAGAWSFSGENTVTAGGFTFNDNVITHFGTGEDVDMYFSGLDFYINLTATNADFRVTGGTGPDQMITCLADGGAFLFYNGGQKLVTTNTGVTVTGTLGATTVTGANVTTGANPGHTHTGSSISSLAAADTTSGTFAAARIPFASSTSIGGIGLWSDTDNPTAANAVTSTASRTYGIQLNAQNQAVVNVPWTSSGLPALNDVTDVNTAGVATGDLLYKSAGDWLDTGGKFTWDPTNEKIRITDSASTDYMEIQANSTNCNFISNANEFTFFPQGAASSQFGIFSGLVGVYNGADFRVLATNNLDYMNVAHDGVDINWTHNATTDWNITGITSIQAGTVDADFDAVTATSFSGANVTTGANPGHTHTGTSISALDAGDITTGTLPVLRGGTGVTTKTGTGNVVLSASPILTGNPTAPTPLTADNDTSIATTAWVKNQGYGAGSGTVTAVNNGSGMNFTNITTSGTVTLGTPGTLTGSTTNALQTASHTHAITTSGSGGIVAQVAPSFTTKITTDTIFIDESNAAIADVAGDGQIWVRNTIPNNLYYTGDTGIDYPVGYGTYRKTAVNTLDHVNVSETISGQYIGGCWIKNTTTARTLTLETSSGTNFPVGAQLAIYNRSTTGNMTVTDTTTQTLWLLDGTTAADSVGGVVIGPGGYATLIRESTTVSVIMGAGIT